MDDRAMVAAIAAGDLAGLAEAYDRYAESLYGYCHTMLGEPEDAADAVQDTFVIAGARLGGLGDPRKLRPWLYAVARNECHRRLGATKVELDEADDLVDPSADAGDSSEQAELRRLARAALDGLSPGEREVIELDLRHDLHGADLAAVLGVPRNQAHALASRARGQLEKALGALLVARTGRRACPELDLLLEDWDGRLTVLTRKRVGRHIDQCDVCTDRMHGVLGRAALYGMAPLSPLPDELREDVLGLCADAGPLAQSYREDVLQGAGSFRPNGFPQPIRQRWLALSGVLAAVGVLIAIAATGIVTVLALGGSHTPQRGEAARSGNGHSPGPAAAAVTTSPGSAGATSPSLSPATGAPAVTSAPPPAAPSSVSASPTKAKPSLPATSSAPPSPTPTPRRPTPTPTSTATPTPRPTGTPSLPL
ncbi:MAG TPA: sigma-70 family RNA polymerase sigma factor [Trebonia sp.]|nr:sigma-70 family RNA polymerase sigma factor [Trebonia sp.]